MKELTIEEKANAYDKIREKIAIRFGSNVADEIFSEHEDNKDEKIRKTLIRFHGSTIDIDGIKSSDIVAWLEKQSEQNSIIFKAKDWYVSKVDGKIHNMTYNPADKKELKKIESTEHESEEELSDFEAALFSAFSDGWQQYLNGEEIDMAQWAKEHSSELLEVANQNHIAWSEEDEKILNDIDVTLFEEKSTPNVKYWKFMNWLKSIKERLSS